MGTTFEGKVVLVTGASSGIGEGSAVAFQEAGAKVYGVARRQDALESARSRHSNIHWLLADVSKASQIKMAVEGLVREAGRLDVVVNNAGIFAPGTIEQATEESVRSQFEVNVYGTTFVTQAALPALKLNRGTIINISSAVGHKASPGAAHYGATKAAIESLTRSWALELAPHGVRVNAIAPGPTETEVLSKSGIPAAMLPAVKDSFTKQVPLGRWARIEEVTRWVVALADPGVTWVTGQVFSIDGGMST